MMDKMGGLQDQDQKEVVVVQHLFLVPVSDSGECLETDDDSQEEDPIPDLHARSNSVG
jgi:hypothetical protein